MFKVAHFRNAYQKVGMFASSPDDNRSFTPNPQLNPSLPTVRGYGYQPDGAVGSIEHHLTGRVFIKTDLPVPQIGPNPGGLPTFLFDAMGNPIGVDPAGFTARRALASFLLAYDSNMKPVVGQQVTLTPASEADGFARVALLEARAALGDCDLVAKARFAGREHGYLHRDGVFVVDEARRAPVLSEELVQLVGSRAAAVTFSCVPPGSGYRIGIDRDVDGRLDGDEAPKAEHTGSPRDRP